MKKIAGIFFLVFISAAGVNAQDYYPEWAKGTIWYQIFPERFENGDTSNDPSADKVFINRGNKPEGWHVTPWTQDWFERDDWMGEEYDDIFFRRYGGDIQGIIDRLDYVKELGVNSIYLNPVFEAVSLHKYDASMFHHIDVNFGPDPGGDRKIMESEVPGDPSTWKWTSADSLFLKLIDEVHARDMRIIIDGVFNHTGEQFFAFQDIVENQENSRYKDWYVVHSFDDPSTPDTNEFDYEGWWGVKSLPEIGRSENDLAKGPKDYIFAITKRWMDPNGDGNTEDGIDGWRLDVANEVPTGFWEDWNRLVKSINPESIISGELWDLSPELVGTGKVFDTRMNYNFAYPTVYYIISRGERIGLQAFKDSLQTIRDTYDKQTQMILQNLIGSHDTERLATMIVNPGRQFDRGAKKDNPDFSPRKPTPEEYEYQKIVASFQMFYPGAPFIYYGDEVGMWGGDDPQDRKPMVWDDKTYDDEVITPETGFGKGYGTYDVKQNKDLLAFYKKIISIRNNNPVIKEGDFEFTYGDSTANTFGFSRTLDGEEMHFYFNIGDNDVKIETGSLPGYKTVLNKNGEFESDIIPAKSVVIFSENKPAGL